MSAEISADEIREIRNFYGLTQRSFAALLGIGEASIARYETGATPSKANANLIYAAKNPSFVLECLERDGDALPEAQREKAERVIYAHVTLDTEGSSTEDSVGENSMDATQLYHYVLQQEVLNEQAANIIAKISSFLIKLDDKDESLQQLVDQLALMKPGIVDAENRNDFKLEKIRGYLSFASEYADRRIARISDAKSAGVA